MRKLGYFFIAIIIILCGGIFFGWSYLPSWISNTLSEKMGVSVSIGHLNLTPNTATANNLNIENPAGSTLNKALQIKKIEAKAPISSFFYKHIVIDELLLSNLYLGLEFESATDTSGNWTVIINNLRDSLRKDSTPSEKQRSFLIKELIVYNTQIDLVFRKDDGKIRHLKPIPIMKFKNVSSEGPLPAGQLLNMVMTEILKKVFIEEHLKDMLKDAIQNPGKGVYKSIKSLFSVDNTIKPINRI